MSKENGGAGGEASGSRRRGWRSSFETTTRTTKRLSRRGRARCAACSRRGASRVESGDALSSRSARASAAAKKRSRRPSLRRVKISERRDAAASGESGGRWSGAWCAAVARASRVSIDTTSARSPIDRDASRGPRDGSACGGKKTDLARSVGDRVGTDHDAGDAPAVLGTTSARSCGRGRVVDGVQRVSHGGSAAARRWNECRRRVGSQNLSRSRI